MSDRLRRALGISLTALSAAVCALAFTFAEARQPDEYRAKGLPPLAVNAVRLRHGAVRVNTSDADSLTALPGIGRSTAEKIVAERRAHGDYHYPEDLLAVKGIGEKKLAGLRDMLDLRTGGE